MKNNNYRRATTTTISDIVDVKSIFLGVVAGSFAIAVVGIFILTH